jgi:hypothetical protein
MACIGTEIYCLLGMLMGMPMVVQSLPMRVMYAVQEEHSDTSRVVDMPNTQSLACMGQSYHTQFRGSQDRGARSLAVSLHSYKYVQAGCIDMAASISEQRF